MEFSNQNIGMDSLSLLQGIFPQGQTQVSHIAGRFSTSVDHDKLWKILKQMGIPDHLTCLLRNLHAGQEATVRTLHGKMNWFKIGQEV